MWCSYLVNYNFTQEKYILKIKIGGQYSLYIYIYIYIYMYVYIYIYRERERERDRVE